MKISLPNKFWNNCQSYFIQGQRVNSWLTIDTIKHFNYRVKQRNRSCATSYMEWKLGQISHHTYLSGTLHLSKHLFLKTLAFCGQLLSLQPRASASFLVGHVCVNEVMVWKGSFCVCPASKRRCYSVMSSLIGLTPTRNYPWYGPAVTHWIHIPLAQ